MISHTDVTLFQTTFRSLISSSLTSVGPLGTLPLTSSTSAIISQLHQIQCYGLWDLCFHCRLSPFLLPKPQDTATGRTKQTNITSCCPSSTWPLQLFDLSQTSPGPHPTEAVSDLPHSPQAPCFFFHRIHRGHFHQTTRPTCNRSVISFSLPALSSSHPVPFLEKQSIFLISSLTFQRYFMTPQAKIQKPENPHCSLLINRIWICGEKGGHVASRGNILGKSTEVGMNE